MIGFEVELDRRVADASGQEIEGDRNLANCADGAFKVVTDLRDAPRVDNPKREADYSNIELVTKPFDQALGLDALIAAVKSMRIFTAACYSVKGVTNLGKVLQNSGLQYELTADGVSAGIHPASDLIVKSGRKYRVNDQGQNSLFVHYTVGYPVGSLYEALEWVTDRTRKGAEDDEDGQYPITNARRGGRAGRAAAELFGRWAQAYRIAVSEADARALAGFVALVCTQVAASIDHADPESSGQIKNRTVVVSRVPLRAVALALPDVVRAFLRQQAWVDMLNDYNVGPSAMDLASFIDEQAEAAQEVVEDRELDGADAENTATKLQGKIVTVKQRLAGIYRQLETTTAKSKLKTLQQRRLKALESLADLETDLERQKDIWSDYRGAVQARDEWNQLRSALPSELGDLNTARISGTFPWSIIGQAMAPAFDGRWLADNLGTAAPDDLFKPAPDEDEDDSDQRAPDGGLSRELDTGTTSDLGGQEITVDEYVRSALLAPCQRPIWQTMLFGGMHELNGPDIFRVGDGRTCALIPLELRSFGKSEITWDELGAALNEITSQSLQLMQAALR